MGVFKDTEQLYRVLVPMWEEAFSDEDIRKKFEGMNVTVHFIVHDPEGELWLFPPGEVVKGKTDRQPIGAFVEMEMDADIAHKFWCDKLNVPLAMAKGQIKAKGPVTKVLGLVPLLKPVKKLYPKRCESEGIPLA